MCIDYTDLNKHCSKDPFPLPRIDQVMDSTAGSILLYFLDCYLGYHQIALHPVDEDKTAFITPRAGRKARSSLARSNSLVSSLARLGSLGNLNRAKLRFQLAMITSRARAGSRAAREP
jgi:hypothetical protein